MRKQTRIILTVVGLLLGRHGWADTPPPAAQATITVVNLNLLNGIACNDGEQCRVRDRIALLRRHIVAVGCPDFVTLEENVTSEFIQSTATGDLVGPLDDTVTLLEEELPALAMACGFLYGVIFDPAARRPPVAGRGIDEELILTRYPVQDPMHASEVLPLYSPVAPFFFRHVLYARIAHPGGPVDVFVTHLASDSDLATVPCGVNALPAPLRSPDCPPECTAFADTVRECQAKQVALFVATRHDVPEPAIIAGDFNAVPGSTEYHEFIVRGWRDSHLQAGNPECDPLTGEDCTAGRVDNNLSELQALKLNQTERIDFLFVVPPQAGAHCAGVIQPADRPGVLHTGLFAAEPNPFAPVCGAAPLPICWPSDHSGNALLLRCQGPPGDLNGDGMAACDDLAIVKAAFGKRTGQPGFDPRADTNNDGVVNVKDLAFVAQKLPTGTRCP